MGWWGLSTYLKPGRSLLFLLLFSSNTRKLAGSNCSMQRTTRKNASLFSPFRFPSPSSRLKFAGAATSLVPIYPPIVYRKWTRSGSKARLDQYATLSANSISTSYKLSFGETCGNDILSGGPSWKKTTCVVSPAIEEVSAVPGPLSMSSSFIYIVQHLFKASPKCVPLRQGFCCDGRHQQSPKWHRSWRCSPSEPSD